MSGRLQTQTNAPEARAAPRQRVILLGASNLIRGLDWVVQTAGTLWGAPLEVLAACGHGRSFGRPSRVLVRQLPGIVECGLWDELARRPEVPASALVTDIGNDILYEEPLDEIAAWVETCFDRLVAARARTVVALLPVDNLPHISPARFRFFRTLLVPGCRLEYEEIVRRVVALDRRVQRMADQRGFATIRPRREWYGLDPIHIRLFERRRAWHAILSAWAAPDPLPQPSGAGLWRSLYLRTRTPERRRLFGFVQRGRQPSARFGDGTTVASY